MLRLKVIPQMGFYKILLMHNYINRFIHSILEMKRLQRNYVTEKLFSAISHGLEEVV
jgi:hypothetical protein